MVMTNRITRTLMLAMLLAPASAYAQGDAPAKNPAAMGCPMMGQMTAMQKDIGGLMGDMDAMMKGAPDPAARARMQIMRDHMTVMMANMQMMGGGMMGGAMPTLQGGKEPSPPPAAAEDHNAHHPDK
jgi:hypothetical protein